MVEKVEKIYLFSLVESQYGVLNYFVEELAASLDRLGIITKLIKKKDPREFLDEILADPPDCTLSFNGLLPDESDRFLCDLINIPHVAYLVDSPIYFAHLIKSHLNIVVSVDLDFCEAFKKANFPQVLFLPHACSSQLPAPSEKQERPYDLLMLNSMIDPDEVRLEWHGKYPKELIAVLEEAAHLTLTQAEIPYGNAFLQVFSDHLKNGKQLDAKKFSFIELLSDLEFYIEGKALTELVRSIEDKDLHIFGSASKGWKKYLRPGQKNVHIHHEVEFLEALNLMKKAKILLNCTPKMKRAGHERIYCGLASEAAVMTLKTPYISNEFAEGVNILSFEYGKWDELNKSLDYYLKHENERVFLAKNGRAKVMREDTWDQRAEKLIKELPKLLENARSKK